MLPAYQAATPLLLLLVLLLFQAPGQVHQSLPQVQPDVLGRKLHNIILPLLHLLGHLYFPLGQPPHDARVQVQLLMLLQPPPPRE